MTLPTSAPLRPADAAAGVDGLRSVARGGVVSVVGGLGNGVLQLALVLAVTHLLPVTLAGVFFAVTSLFVVVAAGASLGADTGLVRMLPRLVHEGQRGLMRPTLRSAAVPVLLVSTALALLGAALTPLFLEGTGLPTPAVVMVVVVCLVLPAAVLLDLACATTRALGSMAPTVLVDRLGRTAAQAAGVAVAGAVGASAWVVGLAWAVPFVLAAPVAVVMAVRSLATASARLAADAAQDVPGRDAVRAARRDFWAFTGPRGVARLLQIALIRVDVVLVAALLGAREAAVYAAASRLLFVGTVGVVAVQQALQPQLSRLMASGDARAVLVLFRQSTAWSIMCSWPVFLVLGTASPVAARLLGDGYSDAALPLSVLCAAMLFATWAGPVDIVVLMAGRSRWSLGNAAAALVTDVALLVVLVPTSGIVGAALAWAAAIVVRNALPLVQARRLLGAGSTSRGGLLAAGSAVLLLGLPVGVIGWLSGYDPVTVGAAALVGGAAYLCALWWSRTALHLDAFAGLLRRRRGRVSAGGAA